MPRGIKGSKKPTVIIKVRLDYRNELKKMYSRKISRENGRYKMSFNEALGIALKEITKYRSGIVEYRNSNCYR